MPHIEPWAESWCKKGTLWRLKVGNWTMLSRGTPLMERRWRLWFTACGSEDTTYWEAFLQWSLTMWPTPSSKLRRNWVPDRHDSRSSWPNSNLNGYIDQEDITPCLMPWVWKRWLLTSRPSQKSFLTSIRKLSKLQSRMLHMADWSSKLRRVWSEGIG